MPGDGNFGLAKRRRGACAKPRGMKVGILQAGHIPAEMAARHGSYPAMFERLLDGHGFGFESWSVVDGVFPSSPLEADGWLITGSRHGAYDPLPWIAPLETLIRDVVAAERPLIGVCFGHQIIAQALGGRVEKFSGGWSVGPKPYHFGRELRVVHAWHQDQVTGLPDGAEIVASSDFCELAALLWPGRIYTVQPHPEFDDAFLQDLRSLRGPGLVPDALLRDVDARLGTALDSRRLADEFARFLSTRRLA